MWVISPSSFCGLVLHQDANRKPPPLFGNSDSDDDEDWMKWWATCVALSLGFVSGHIRSWLIWRSCVHVLWTCIGVYFWGSCNERCIASDVLSVSTIYLDFVTGLYFCNNNNCTKTNALIQRAFMTNSASPFSAGRLKSEGSSSPVVLLPFDWLLEYTYFHLLRVKTVAMYFEVQCFFYDHGQVLYW